MYFVIIERKKNLKKSNSHGTGNMLKAHRMPISCHWMSSECLMNAFYLLCPGGCTETHTYIHIKNV